MTKALFDTNLYVDWLNAGKRESIMVGPGLVRYLSSVVLMELRAGAVSRGPRRLLDQLVRAHRAADRLIAPAARVFDDAGLVLRALRVAGREVRRASLVDDVLIALTAREIGATMYTANAGDFGVIRQVRDFTFEVV